MTTTTLRRLLAALAALLFVTGAAACGDDDTTESTASETTDTGDEAAETTDTGEETTDTGDEAVTGDLAEYCAQSAALDEQTEVPTEEQLDAIIAVAPEEIRADLELFIGKFLELGGDEAALEELFTDEEAYAAATRVEGFEQENCDTGEDTEETTGDDSSAGA